MLGFERLFGNKGSGAQTPEVVAAQPERNIKEWKKPEPLPEEDILESREMGKAVQILGGENRAELVQFLNDGFGILKKSEARAGLKGMSEAKCERAAYIISRYLGFDFVPPTAIRDVDSRTSSVQEFVLGAKVAAEAGSLKAFFTTGTVEGSLADVPGEEFMKLRVFDTLISNSDRHEGNFLIKDGKIIAVDHGRSLDPENLTYGAGRVSFRNKIPAQVLENLASYRRSKEGRDLLRTELVKCLGKYTADDYLQRIDFFIDSLDSEGYLDTRKFNKSVGTLSFIKK